MSFVATRNVTISNGTSLSGALDVADYTVVGVITDSAWDTAAITFQASADGTNFFSLFNAGTEISFAAATASSYHIIDPALMLGVRAIKVRSGTAGTPVNQVGDAVVTVIIKPI